MSRMRPVGAMDWPKRYKVASERNSACSYPLRKLDWTRWWTDGLETGLYLHVHSKEGETIHRVWCKHSSTPRLRCDGGELLWLVDCPPDLQDEWLRALAARAARPKPNKRPNVEATPAPTTRRSNDD